MTATARMTGPYRLLRPGDDMAITRARLTNWARWARDASEHGYQLSSLWPQDLGTYSADELDAALVERVLCALKGSDRLWRRRLWWALEERYLRSRDVLSAASAQRIPVAVYEQRLRSGERMVGRMLR